jgi:pimeloyl-ACP methyl ester carboxylesterase
VFPRVFSAAEFAQVEAPTLLLIGDHEKIYPPGAATEAAIGLVPGIATGLIAGAHHISAIAQPRVVTQRILQHVAEHPL